MIVVNTEFKHNDLITILDIIMPPVLSTLITDYLKPYTTFILKFSRDFDVNIYYSSMHIATIQFNLQINRIIISNTKYHYSYHNTCVSLLCKYIIEDTQTWLTQLKS